MRLLSLLWRPTKPGDTPGQVEPNDAPARDIDARPTWQAWPCQEWPTLRTYPQGWVTCTYCGRAAGIGMLHVCPERRTLR